MDGDHEQVEEEEDKEDFAVPSNLVRQRLEANTEMAMKFYFNVIVVKTRACIDSLIGDKYVPLADHGKEQRCDDCTKTG